MMIPEMMLVLQCDQGNNPDIDQHADQSFLRDQFGGAIPKDDQYQRRENGCDGQGGVRPGSIRKDANPADHKAESRQDKRDAG